MQRGFERLLEGESIEPSPVCPARGRTASSTSPRAAAAWNARCSISPRKETRCRREPASRTPPASGTSPSRSTTWIPSASDFSRSASPSFRPAPVEVPFRVADAGRKRLCYFHDPDGVLLEVAEYDPRKLEDAEDSQPVKDWGPCYNQSSRRGIGMTIHRPGRNMEEIARHAPDLSGRRVRLILLPAAEKKNRTQTSHPKPDLTTAASLLKYAAGLWWEMIWKSA